jgi:hypothetical protein
MALIQGPPQGGPLGGGAVGGGGAGGGIPGRPDSPKIGDLVDQAAQLLQQALGLEKDPEDKAMISSIVADLHKFAGAQQKLIDQATGAGPGAKVVRKAAPGPSGY